MLSPDMTIIILLLIKKGVGILVALQTNYFENSAYNKKIDKY